MERERKTFAQKCFACFSRNATLYDEKLKCSALMCFGFEKHKRGTTDL